MYMLSYSLTLENLKEKDSCIPIYITPPEESSEFFRERQGRSLSSIFPQI